jgi:ribosome-associated translation inhibitor RaiA
VEKAQISVLDMRHSPVMRIQVLGDDTISQQARTYAEYRVFAALTQLSGADQVTDASVVLRHVKRSGDDQVVTCMVTVTREGSNTMRVRTTGDHPYAAINRAVERLRSTSTSERVDWGVVENG